MLTGPELGKALEAAMAAKGVVQREVATEFKVKQPSVSEWIKHGRVGKRHINHLVEYFSDVVRPSHWGLPDEWGAMPPPPKSPSPEAEKVAAQFDRLNPEQRQTILALLGVYAPIKGVEAAAAQAAEREPKPAPLPSTPQPAETPPVAPSGKRAR